MTHEVYEAVAYQLSEHSTNSLGLITARSSSDGTEALKVLFMIGGRATFVYSIARSDNVRVQGTMNIKDEEGNIIASSPFIQTSNISPEDIIFDVEPFKTYTFEPTYTQGEDYVSGLNGRIKAHLIRRNRFMVFV